MSKIKTGGIFLINKKFELLIAHPTKHAGNFWSIPKGRLEKGEDDLTAGLREMWEESNVDFREEPFNYYGLEEQSFKNNSKILNSFVIFEQENDIDFSQFEFKCNADVKVKNGDNFPEMDDYKWVKLGEAKEYVHYTQMICIEIIEEMLKDIKFRKPLN